MRIVRRPSKGSVLIVSIGVLALLSILAVSFFRAMRVERSASDQHRRAVAARMLSAAGVEQAVASLQEESIRAETGAPISSAWPNPAAVGLAGSGALSFGAEDRHVRGVPYTGCLPVRPSDRGIDERGLQYQLRVLDAAQLVHIGRLPADGEGPVRLLDNLGSLLADGFVESVNVRDPARPAAVVAREQEFRFTALDGRLGTVLLEAQAGGAALDSFDDVAAVLRAAYGEIDADLALLRRLVTFHGVEDPAAVGPDLDGPVGSGRLVGGASRAPINVNRADRLVLAATLLGIEARYRHRDPSDGSWADDGAVSIDRQVALTVADELVAAREGRSTTAPATHVVVRPFADWAALEALVHRLASDGRIAPEAADLILANANPHPRPVHHNPDVASRYRPDGSAPTGPYLPAGRRKAEHRIWIDRSDLRRYTTEFCLESPGVYEIESVGRVVATDGTTLARHGVRTVVRVAREVHLRTQERFLDLAAADVAARVAVGPESVLQDVETGLRGPRFGRADGQNASAVSGSLHLDDGYFDEGATRLSLPRHVDLEPRAGRAVDLHPGQTYVYEDGSVARRTMLPNRNEPGSVFAGGHRASDGYVSRRAPDDGYVRFESSGAGRRGGLGLWVKLDEGTLDADGVGLYFSTRRDPQRPDTFVQRAVTLQRGALRITTTWYALSGSVPRVVPKNSFRLAYSGELRSDAADRLFREGYEWLRERIPGQDDRYYRAFADQYSRQALDGIRSGRSTIQTYIYEAERAAGLGHLGCITKTTTLADKVDLVFEPGTIEFEMIPVRTEIDPFSVNETDRFTYRRISPNMETVVENGIEIRRPVAFENCQVVDLLAEAERLLREAGVPATGGGGGGGGGGAAAAGAGAAAGGGLPYDPRLLEERARQLLDDAGCLRDDADRLEAAAREQARLAAGDGVSGEDEARLRQLMALLERAVVSSALFVDGDVVVGGGLAVGNESAALQRQEAERLRRQAAELEGQAAELIDRAYRARARARRSSDEIGDLVEAANQRYRQAIAEAHLTGELDKLRFDPPQLALDELQNPYRFSRVEVEIRKPRDWNPGEWHHVTIGFDDELETGRVTVLLDNETPSVDRHEVDGPLEIWGSRQVAVADEFFPGPFVLRRASDETSPGEDLGGLELRMAGDLTLADYRIYDVYRPAPPIQGRYAADDARFAFRFDLRELDRSGFDVPPSWPLRGTITLRARQPLVGRTDGRAPEPMVDLAVAVEGAPLEDGRSIPAGLLARDANGRYLPFETTIDFHARAMVGPFVAADRKEAGNQMHSPIIEGVVFRFLVPPATLLWEEIERP